VQLAADIQQKKDVKLEPSFDMWQLGMLVYQLAVQEWPWARPYWSQPLDCCSALPDAEILRRLVDYHQHPKSKQRAQLPHEARPLQDGGLRVIVEKLLTPHPGERWSSEALRHHLDLYNTSLQSF
jgi:hypothetical protein